MKTVVQEWRDAFVCLKERETWRERRGERGQEREDRREDRRERRDR